jgi:hypothetical protein
MHWKGRRVTRFLYFLIFYFFISKCRRSALHWRCPNMFSTLICQARFMCASKEVPAMRDTLDLGNGAGLVATPSHFLSPSSSLLFCPLVLSLAPAKSSPLVPPPRPISQCLHASFVSCSYFVWPTASQLSIDMPAHTQLRPRPPAAPDPQGVWSLPRLVFQAF